MRKKYYWFHDVHTSIEDDQFKKICESMAFFFFFFFLRPFLSYCFVCFLAIDFAFFFQPVLLLCKILGIIWNLAAFL